MTNDNGPRTAKEKSLQGDLRLIFQSADIDLAKIAKLWIPIAILTLVGLVVAFQFVEPAPPNRLVISSGSPEGAYHSFALQYAEHLKKEGIELVVQPSSGSVDNLEKLKSGEVQVALVQGGTVPQDQKKNLESLASIYLEPLWIFYQKGSFSRQNPPRRVNQLGGKKLAIGPRGSGTRALTLQLLEKNGIDGDKGKLFMPLTGQKAVAALTKGEVDAAFFVISPKAQYLKSLIGNDSIDLMDFQRSKAYTRHYRYMKEVEVSQGLLDLADNQPPQSTALLATTATLVVNKDFHPSLIPLLIQAARNVHYQGGLLEDVGQFPSPKYVDAPINKTAQYYFENGPSFLYRVFPFWFAALFDRLKILLLPLVTLLIPLFKMAPPIYRWRIRSKIYKWYQALRLVDEQMQIEMDLNMIEADLISLEAIEKEVAEVDVPLSYMEEFYNLRLHIDFVVRKLKEWRAQKVEEKQGKKATAPPSPPTTPGISTRPPSTDNEEER